MQATRLSDTPRHGQSTWRDYLELTRPRATLVQTIPALAAMFVATETMPPLETIFFTALGIYLAAGGASALNCYIDADIDAVMKRTQERPIPAQRLGRDQALYFGIAISLLSFLVLWLGANLLAAVLGAAGISIYVLVYSLWLKRRTPYSTLAGALAAAIIPLVGWAAATGTLSINALVLAAFVFYWIPPHYWSLALVESREYLRAGLPMMPVIQGNLAVRIQIGRYAVLMVVLSLLPIGLGMAHVFYAMVALALGGAFIYIAAQLMMTPSLKLAWHLHKYSDLYLALLFVALMADRVIFF